MKNTSIFLLLVSLIILAACSSNNAPDEESGTKEAAIEADETMDLNAIQEVSTDGSLSKLKEQQGGKETSEISIKADTAKNDENVNDDDLIDAAVPFLKKTI